MSLLCGSLLVLSASPLFAADASPPEAQFRAGTTAWIAAYNAGEVDKILALYANDAVVMPPDAPTPADAVALRAYLTQGINEAKTGGLRLSDGPPGGSGASGDLGWHSGTFSLLAADGKTVGTGKYLEIWQKRQGKWVIARDIWNNDAPVPAPAPTADAK
jgi:ketosteroid isomerase-like protein